MTTENPTRFEATVTHTPNPRHVALADAFLKKLEEMPVDHPEEFLTLKVTLRHGIARRAKWTREVEDESIS